MTLPSNLNSLAQQLNDELNNLEHELSKTIELIRVRIALFPDNILLIRVFATLNNYALFTGNTRKRVQETVQYLTTHESLSNRDIQEAGEDLSEQLGRVLEAKIVVINLRRRLEN